MQQGMQRGQAKVLSRMLASRFGELPLWVHQKLANATEAELDVWTDAILVAASPEDVFAESPKH